MVIIKKSDADTAEDLLRATEGNSSYELRAQTYGPTNPKFSTK